MDRSNVYFSKAVESAILLETFLQIRLTFGVVEERCGGVLLGNGPIGCALKLLAAMKEVLKLMELITHPSAILASRLIAGHKPRAAIGGHADAVEEVVAEVFKMPLPGLSRAIRSPFDFENRRTLRLQGD